MRDERAEPLLERHVDIAPERRTATAAVVAALVAGALVGAATGWAAAVLREPTVVVRARAAVVCPPAPVVPDDGAARLRLLGNAHGATAAGDASDGTAGAATGELDTRNETAPRVP